MAQYVTQPNVNVTGVGACDVLLEFDSIMNIDPSGPIDAHYFAFITAATTTTIIEIAVKLNDLLLARLEVLALNSDVLSFGSRRGGDHPYADASVACRTRELTTQKNALCLRTAECVICIKDTRFQSRSMIRLWMPKDRSAWGRVSLFDVAFIGATPRRCTTAP